MKDYYGILGVPPTATQDEIREAYRRLAFEWHPDRNPHQREQAHARFLDLGEAYAVLKDGRQRLDYDRGRSSGSSSASPPRSPPGPAPQAEATDEAPRSAESAPMAAEFAHTAHAAATLREYHGRVHELARELASVDRPGRRIDVALVSLAMVGLVMSFVLTAFRLIGLNLPELRPSLWSVVITWMSTIVLVTWLLTLRARRVEQYVPYAEEVLERTGHGWAASPGADFP